MKLVLPEQKNKMIGARLSEKDYNKLSDIAKKEGVGLGTLAGAIINAGLKELKCVHSKEATCDMCPQNK